MSKWKFEHEQFPHCLVVTKPDGSKQTLYQKDLAGVSMKVGILMDEMAAALMEKDDES